MPKIKKLPVGELYANESKSSNNEIDLRITKKDGSQSFIPVGYRSDFGDWAWKSST